MPFSSMTFLSRSRKRGGEEEIGGTFGVHQAEERGEIKIKSSEVAQRGLRDHDVKLISLATFALSF